MTTKRHLIPESYAEALNDLVAEDQSRTLQVLFGVPKPEADRRGREFIDAWIGAGCPALDGAESFPPSDPEKPLIAGDSGL